MPVSVVKKEYQTGGNLVEANENSKLNMKLHEVMDVANNPNWQILDV